MLVHYAAIIAALIFFATNARAQQHDHAQYHNVYQGWASKLTSYCCNNQDCGIVDDEAVEDTPSGTLIYIDGEWCPVKQEHRVIVGRSPDWTHAHACIQPNLQNYSNMDGTVGPKPPCERLLCFMGKPGG